MKKIILFLLLTTIVNAVQLTIEANKTWNDNQTFTITVNGGNWIRFDCTQIDNIDYTDNNNKAIATNIYNGENFYTTVDIKWQSQKQYKLIARGNEILQSCDEKTPQTWTTTYEQTIITPNETTHQTDISKDRLIDCQLEKNTMKKTYDDLNTQYQKCLTDKAYNEAISSFCKNDYLQNQTEIIQNMTEYRTKAQTQELLYKDCQDKYSNLLVKSNVEHENVTTNYLILLGVAFALGWFLHGMNQNRGGIGGKMQDSLFFGKKPKGPMY